MYRRPPSNSGCIFTDGKTILAGYQPNKKVPILSGFGGKLEPNEIPIETAWREVIEELVGIEVPRTLVETLQEHLVPYDRFEKDGYIAFVYSYTMLEKFLEICQTSGAQSPFYTVFPLTLSELIFNRKTIISQEITTLCILPVVQPLIIDTYFSSDIQKVYTTLYK